MFHVLTPICPCPPPFAYAREFFFTLKYMLTLAHPPAHTHTTWPTYTQHLRFVSGVGRYSRACDRRRVRQCVRKPDRRLGGSHARSGAQCYCSGYCCLLAPGSPPSFISLSPPPLPFSVSRLFTRTKVQEDPAAYVPYGVEAAAAGKEWAGGKLDDTCALVLKFQ